MKPTQHWPRKEQNHLIQRPYFPACCEHPCDQAYTSSPSAFKKKQFISLSKNIDVPQEKPVLKEKSVFKAFTVFKGEHKQEEGTVFEQDKSSFLQQIRKYNPNPQQQKELESSPAAVTMNTTKEIPYSPGSTENNLSNLLQTLNNEMFSDMFVSSSVKGRIILSGSLGSITEVKSEMQISCPSEPFAITPQNTDRTFHH